MEATVKAGVKAGAKAACWWFRAWPGGIDAAAHRGTLATGTLAVQGGGVDVIYPKENAALYESIKAEGAILSEIAPETQPQARHFPRATA